MCDICGSVCWGEGVCCAPVEADGNDLGHDGLIGNG